MQGFYEDTVIVLLGDHPRMERVLVPSGFEKADRTNYNCIINATNTTEDVNYYNRTFTAMDYFPTILSAMGFYIEGDRLGLGTNLFSKEETLPEKIGFEYFKKELSKHSEFYIKNFS
jgi:phosphoglycerol transferase